MTKQKDEVYNELVLMANDIINAFAEGVFIRAESRVTIHKDAKEFHFEFSRQGSLVEANRVLDYLVEKYERLQGMIEIQSSYGIHFLVVEISGTLEFIYKDLFAQEWKNILDYCNLLAKKNGFQS